MRFKYAAYFTDTSGLNALLAEELSSAKEKAREEEERKEEEKRAAHVRPWDRGKSEWREGGRQGVVVEGKRRGEGGREGRRGWGRKGRRKGERGK